jgi:hypothetical protein
MKIRKSYSKSEYESFSKKTDVLFPNPITDSKFEGTFGDSVRFIRKQSNKRC